MQSLYLPNFLICSLTIRDNLSSFIEDFSNLIVCGLYTANYKEEFIDDGWCATAEKIANIFKEPIRWFSLSLPEYKWPPKLTCFSIDMKFI